jgi:small subunit ribosomal protein S18
MSEQENPTTNSENVEEMTPRMEEAQTPAVEASPAEAPAAQAPAPQRQAAAAAAREPAAAAQDYTDDDTPEERMAGPGEYTPPERESRSRRVGSDVRLEDVSFRNVDLLTRFIDGRGRILSRRKTRVSAKMQRRVVRAIKQARHLALLPYTADQSRIVRKRR